VSGQLEGKVAIVTGGTRGLGLAIARTFLSEGASVVVTGRNEGSADEARRVLDAVGADYDVLRADASDPSMLDAVFEAARGFGSVGILVNNAGQALLKRMVDTTLDEWNAQFAVHATAPFLATQRAVETMTTNETQGCILNISSVIAEAGAPLASAYSASKAALLGFTRSVAKEVASHGIRVNALCPGAMATDMFVQDTIGTMAQMFNRDADKLMQSTLNSIPLKRLLQTSEVAQLALFLCSDAASGITGQSYKIACGADIHA